MVTDRITDGRRIAELLASELEGRTDTGLDRVGLANVDRSITPSAAGDPAYDVTLDGSPVGTALVRPDDVVLAISEEPSVVREAATERGLPTTSDLPDHDPAVLLEDGAAVKRGVDVLTAVIDDQSATE